MTSNQSHLQINPDYWGFMLGGFVRIPLMLSYKDVLRLPAVETPCTISCAGTISGLDTGTWRGVRLQTLLDQIEIRPEAQHAHFFAADDYCTSIPLDKLPDAVLVYARDDEPLTPEQGAPIRLIVPGLYGYKMPKWIQRIELREQPLNGTWESLGWSVDGTVRTTSIITHPLHLQSVNGTVILRGTAYAGERLITSVEVSVNEGEWMPIDFTQQTTPHRPVEWSTAWTPITTGHYRIKVRATDSKGFSQPDSSRIHTITVEVKA
jgi:hypothetical protein